ncbi:CHAT domain-containing protein, partial [Allocoleopsis sp.]|uniref:CHAT domain-containing protein n=1 Tax=Allocoleopsis sp. TaxID=3088169 RepID=UPI002FD4C09F
MASKRIVLLRRLQKLGIVRLSNWDLRKAQAKSRLPKFKYRYGFLAILTALYCVVALPMVGRTATPKIAANSSISVVKAQSLPLSSTLLAMVADSTAQPLPNIAKNAESLDQQAKTLYLAGRFSEAVAVLQQLLQVYQTNGDLLGQAVVQSNLALNYQQLGRTQEATQAIAAALKGVEKTHNSSERSAVWAQSLDVQANLQLAKGEAEQAVATWEQAAALYSQLGDTNRATLTRINQAQALQALGLYKRSVSTLQMLKQSLDKQPDSLAKASNLLSLGEALRVIGNLEAAATNLQESLKIAQNLKSPDAIGSAYLSLGNLARTQADQKIGQAQPKEAEKQRQAALDFYQKVSDTAATSQTQIQAQLNRLSLLLEMKKWQEAQALYPQVQGQIANLPVGRPSIYAQVNLARSMMKLHSRGDEKPSSTPEAGAPQDIAQILAVAYKQAEQLNDGRSQAVVLSDLGHLYELQNQWTEAEQLTQRALVLSQQSVNASDIDYEFSWQLGRIFKAQGKYPEAIAAYDEAFERSRSLRADLVATNPDVQFSFRDSVEPVYRQFVDLLLTPPSNEAEPLQKNLQKAREVLEALQVAQLQNFLQQACEEKRLEIDRIIDQKDSHTAVIYPIILDNRLEVMVKLPKEERLYRSSTALSRDSVAKTLKQFKTTLETESPFDQPVKKVGKTVYDWLIAPFSDRLEAGGIKTLIFVLDGSLRTIPMAALYDGERYLVEKYAVSLVLGLEVRDPEPLLRQNMKVLAAGLTDPPKKFENTYSKLQNVQRELDAINEAQIPVKRILDQAFTRKNFQQAMNSNSYQVVHLATHGQFGATRERTYLLAADDAIYVDQLSELFRTRGQRREDAVELLVLSACKTASGNDRAVLGIAGTAVQAGAR